MFAGALWKNAEYKKEVKFCCGKSEKGGIANRRRRAGLEGAYVERDKEVLERFISKNGCQGRKMRKDG